MPRLRAGTISMAAWLIAAPARAEAPLTLEWSAPAGCPDAAWVEASVRRLLSTPPVEPLRVRATVHADAPGSNWVVELKLDGAARGTRTLRAASCESVARASALIVALALDPQAAALASEEMAQAEAPPKPPDPPSSPPPPLHPTPTPRPPPPSPRASLRGHAYAAATLEHGYLPGAAPAGLVGGGLGARFWRADISLQFAPFASTSLTDAPQAGADFAALSVEARGCGGPAWTWVSVFGCGGVRGTRITGRGTGVTESYRGHAEIFSATAGVLVRVPSRTRIAAEASVDGTLPFTRPDFVLLDGDRERSLYRVPVLTGRATLGVSVRF